MSDPQTAAWDALNAADLGKILSISETPEGPINIYERGSVLFTEDGPVITMNTD